MLKVIKIVLLFCLVFSLDKAIAEDNKNAKLILEKAYKLMTTSNYIANIKNDKVSNSGGDIILHYADTDGNSYFKLKSVNSDDKSYGMKTSKGYFAVAFRKDGKYKILASPYGVTSLRSELTFLRGLKGELKYNNITFTLKKIKYNGIECFEILKKEKHMPSPKVLAERKIWKYDPKRIDKIKAQAEKHYPFIKKYIIGVKTPFIYSCEYFNVNGKRGRTYYWSKPDFNVNFTSKDFELPPGAVIYIDEKNPEFFLKALRAWLKE